MGSIIPTLLKDLEGSKKDDAAHDTEVLFALGQGQLAKLIKTVDNHTRVHCGKLKEISCLEEFQDIKYAVNKNSGFEKLVDGVGDIVQNACSGESSEKLISSITGSLKGLLSSANCGGESSFGFNCVLINGALCRVDHACYKYTMKSKALAGDEEACVVGFWWRRVLLDAISADPQVLFSYVEDPETFKELCRKAKEQAELVMYMKTLQTVSKMELKSVDDCENVKQLLAAIPDIDEPEELEEKHDTPAVLAGGLIEDMGITAEV